MSATLPARWRILAVVLVAVFMSLISVSIVNVALPTIQQGLGASQSDLQWVLSGYALTFGVVLVAAGRVGDLVGRGGVFVIGVVVFTLCSIGAGFAPSSGWLILARFLQGVGSGLLNPQAIGMIQQYFHGAERGKAFGAFGSTVAVAIGIGPVLGGLLIKAGGPEIGWRLTFLVNLPVGIVAIALALVWFQRPLLGTPQRRGTRGSGSLLRDFDPVGSVLLGLAVLALLFPFVESETSPLMWLLPVVSLVLVVAWASWERRYSRRGGSPMVDLSIFRTRSFTNGSVIVTLYFFGLTSISVLLALYMQQGLGKSALEAGTVMLPSAALEAVAANWAGRKVTVYGRKVVIAGIYCALAGLAATILVVQLVAHGGISPWWLLLSYAFVGAGHGTVISPNQTLTLSEVPPQHAGSSGAIMQTGQRIGTSIGIAVVTAVTFSVLAHTSWSSAFTIGLVTIGAFMMCALAVAYKDRHDRAKYAGSD